jgi:ABC-type transport system involved in multi-copper enzyme maturation permease subunit
VNLAVFEETIRRHLTSLGYIAFAIFTALAGILASTFNRPASLWPSLVTLLAIITGSALIGPEFSTGTLQLIVSKPVRRYAYVVSRVAGVFVCVALVAAAGAASEIGTRFLGGGFVPWRRIVIVFACSLVVALLAIAMLTFLGSISRAYINAGIYIGALTVLSLLEAVLGIARFRAGVAGELIDRFNVEEILVGFDDALYPSAASPSSADWALRTSIMAVVFVAIACLAFSRREVPYGAD